MKSTALATRKPRAARSCPARVEEFTIATNDHTHAGLPAGTEVTVDRNAPVEHGDMAMLEIKHPGIKRPLYVFGVAFLRGGRVGLVRPDRKLVRITGKVPVTMLKVIGLA